MGWSTVVGLAIVFGPLLAFSILLYHDQQTARTAERVATRQLDEQARLKRVVEDQRDVELAGREKAEGELKLANVRVEELSADVTRLKTAALLKAQGEIDGKTTDALVAASRDVFGRVRAVQGELPLVPKAGGAGSTAPDSDPAQASALPPGRAT